MSFGKDLLGFGLDVLKKSYTTIDDAIDSMTPTHGGTPKQFYRDAASKIGDVLGAASGIKNKRPGSHDGGNKSESEDNKDGK